MNKKRTVLIISIIVFVGIIIVGAFIPKDEETFPTPEPQERPKDSYFSRQVRDNVNLPSEKTIEAGGVYVENFYTNDKDISPKGDVILAETSNYTIFYFNNDDSFLISILSESFDETRKIAEEDLLRQLNITETDACKLDVAITTPGYVNKEKAGLNHPLSFCE